MPQFKLGVTVDTIARPLGTEAIDAMGNSSIATFEYTPKNFAGDYAGILRAQAKAMLERTGKKFISCHVPFARIDDVSDPEEEVRQCALARMRMLIDEAFFFGSKIIVLHPSMEIQPGDPREVRLFNLIRSIGDISFYLKAHDMRLALEWLPRACMGNSLEELFAMLRYADENVGFCLDVNHMMTSYRNLPEIIEEMGSRLFTLHLSDYDGVDEKHWVPGAGVIDWSGVVRALRKIDYRGPFNYECDWPGATPAEKVRAAEENFNTFMAQF